MVWSGITRSTKVAAAAGALSGAALLASTLVTGTAASAATAGRPERQTVTTSDWGTARNINVTVTNSGSTTVSAWKVSVPWGITVTQMWSATNASTAGVMAASNAGWNGTLAPALR